MTGRRADDETTRRRADETTRLCASRFGEASEQELEEALRREFLRACEEAPLPSAGLVWWRASIRARAEAARKAEQPLTVAPAIAGAAMLGAGAGIAGFIWRVIPAAAWSDPLVLGMFAAAVGLVLAPLALVLALSRE